MNTTERINTIVGNEYAAVTQTLGRYYDGLYHGDTSALGQAFHPDARYATVSDGELLHLDMKSYLPRVEARESPESLGEPYGYGIESIEFAGSTAASARMRSSMFGKHFIDLLSLVNVDGEWRIIAKVFHSDGWAPERSNGGK